MNQDSIYSSLKCVSTDSSTCFINSVSLGEIITYVLTIIGIIVALCQFTRQMKETRDLSAKQQSQTWFLYVIVVPQLDNIKTFYNEIVLRVNELRNELVKKESNTSAKKIRLLIAQKQQECKDKVNSFYDHFSALVSSYNKESGNSVSHIGIEVEDICTKLIENYNKDFNVREMIFENEQKLFMQLNKGMK